MLRFGGCRAPNHIRLVYFAAIVGRNGEKGHARDLVADRVQRGEVDGAAESGAQGRGCCAAPESGYETWRSADLAQDKAQGVVARLLDASFEEVDGLEEDGGEGAGAEAGYEVVGFCGWAYC